MAFASFRIVFHQITVSVVAANATYMHVMHVLLAPFVPSGGKVLMRSSKIRHKRSWREVKDGYQAWHLIITERKSEREKKQRENYREDSETVLPH